MGKNTINTPQVLLALGIFISICFCANPVKAADLGLGLEVHAFLSQGFIDTTANNYLAASTAGSFNLTEGGINFTKQLGDDLRMGLQLYAQNLGATDTFQARLDWAYFDYHWNDLLGIRFGRVKIPFGFYNDISDIDSARVPILLPQSIYPIQNRDLLLSQSGFELYGYTGRGPAGGLDYRVYAGTIVVPNANTPWNIEQISSLNSISAVTSLNTRYVVGGRVIWETPLEGLRFGISLQKLELNSTLTFIGSGTPVTVQIPAWLTIGSAEYAYNNFLLTAEYSRWYSQVNNSSDTTRAPDGSTVSERGYVMASYRINNFFEPGIYDSILRPNLYENTGGPSFYQNDLSVTLRFDLKPFWLVKVEEHYMNGTGGLDPTINNNTAQDGLNKTWWATIIKTTAYF